MEKTPLALGEVRQILSYDLDIKGLWGRNRKVKVASFNLKDVPLGEPLTVEQIRGEVARKLATLKLKGSARVLVHVTEVKLEKAEHFTSRSFMMFSGVKVLDETMVGL